MKYLLCDLENNNDEKLKNHYIQFHLINKDNYFFKELFSLNTEKSATFLLTAVGKKITVFYSIIHSLVDEINHP